MIYVNSEAESSSGMLGLDCRVDFCANEISALKKFVEMMRKYDPDIVIGYEIQLNSWGYLVERAHQKSISHLFI